MATLKNGINSVPIRATVTIGNKSVSTPYVLSFSVNKVRNSISTFQASLKMHIDDITAISNNKVVITAGSEGKERVIFTGYNLSSQPTPSWDDPGYVVLNISGKDILHRLEKEKYTRRQIFERNKWALITGLERRAIKGAQFELVNQETMTSTGGDFKNDFEKNNQTKPAEQAPVQGEPLKAGVADNPVVKVHNPEYVDDRLAP